MAHFRITWGNRVDEWVERARAQKEPVTLDKVELEFGNEAGGVKDLCAAVQFEVCPHSGVAGGISEGPGMGQDILPGAKCGREHRTGRLRLVEFGKQPPSAVLGSRSVASWTSHEHPKTPPQRIPVQVDIQQPLPLAHHRRGGALCAAMLVAHSGSGGPKPEADWSDEGFGERVPGKAVRAIQ